MAPRKHIDWRAVLEDLRGKYPNLSALARRLDCPVSSLHDLVSGVSREPRYGLGLRLLQLYQRERRRRESHEH